MQPNPPPMRPWTGFLPLAVVFAAMIAGACASVRATSSSTDALVREAVRPMTYRPARKDGVPVAVLARYGLGYRVVAVPAGQSPARQRPANC